MIIENSQVTLYSKTQYSFEHSQSTSIQLHYGEKSTTNESNISIGLNLQESYSLITQNSRVLYDYEDNLTPEDRIKKIIIEILLGRLNENKTESTLYPNKKSGVINNNSLSSTNPYKVEQLKEKELKAIVFNTQEEYYQKQDIKFSSSVKIQTPTQSFEMNIDLSFSQEFYESQSTQIIIGDKSFIDPLVINYDEEVNPFANISNLHFAFDLDSDGTTEMIPQLKRGAGFLALDKNDNEKIDNGNELFGPNTNDGFAELTLYDNDKNNWIDEKDAVFYKLKIYSIDENGNHSLVSLIDRNVGAIYLGDVQSGFKYQSAINQTDAVQKSNGVFIKEDGSGLGVVNSIDIVA
jgi:hypothetical protein